MDEDRRPSRLAHLANTDDGWSHSAEFVSAVLVWTLFGWLADRWLDTTPWLVATGGVVGFALGTYLLWLRLRDATD
jgi:F0F1-type ATP synthase assembly protein I